MRPQICRLLLTLSLVVPLAAVRAQPDTRAVLTLKLNQAPHGEVFPVLRGEDVLIPVDDLRRAQIEVGALAGRRESIGETVYVSLRSLAPGVTYTLDAENAELSLTVPPALLPLSRVDLRSSLRPAGIELARDSSAFLNYAASMRAGQLTLAAEAAAGTGDLLLSSTAFWNVGRSPVRGLSQLTLDTPAKMLRAIAGDSQVNSGLLGGGAILGGLHLSRNFELDPYFLRSPAFDFAGSVATPSTVDVYVNGSLIRHAELPPGPFNLANLPLGRGKAGTQYVLRDAFGREREVAASQYVAAGLLAPGLSAFNVSLGLRREQLATESFRYGGPAFLGFYRRGLTPWLTGGLRLEVAKNLVSGGTSFSFGLPVGELELAAAGSLEDSRGGVAGAVSYAYVSRGLGVQTFLRAMSPSYATLGMTARQDHPLFNAGANVSTSVTPRIRLGSELVSFHFRDAGTSLRASLQGVLRLSSTASLTVSGSATSTQASGVEYASTASLNMTLGENTTGALLGQHGSHGPGVGVDINHALPAETGFGYRVRGQLAELTQGDATVAYQGAYGRYSAGLEWAEGKPIPTADVAGSVVALDGHVGFARPIEQGFALVRTPGLAGARVFLNNHEVAQTDTQGTAIIPNLLPYYGNRLSISDQDIPDDFGVPTLDRLIAPYARRGATVQFSTRRIRPIRGTLALDGVDSSVLSYGELTLRQGTEVFHSPIGSKGEFELEGVSPGPHEASITYAGGVCHARLEVPATDAHLIDLDVVPCLSR